MPGAETDIQPAEHLLVQVYGGFYRASSYASTVLGVKILSVCLSVCPPVIRVLYDKTKQCTADILIPHKRAVVLVF